MWLLLPFLSTFFLNPLSSWLPSTNVSPSLWELLLQLSSKGGRREGMDGRPTTTNGCRLAASSVERRHVEQLLAQEQAIPGLSGSLHLHGWDDGVQISLFLFFLFPWDLEKARCSPHTSTGTPRGASVGCIPHQSIFPQTLSSPTMSVWIWHPVSFLSCGSLMLYHLGPFDKVFFLVTATLLARVLVVT